MISKKEAVLLTQEAKERLADPKQIRREAFINEAEDNIRAAAGRGQNQVVWTVGTKEFVEDITKALKEQGFDVSFDMFSFTVIW